MEGFTWTPAGGLDPSNVTLQGNRLTNDGSGGGVFNVGYIRIYDGVVSQNFGVNGGGIYNRGDASIDGALIKGNSAVDGAGVFNVRSENIDLPCFASMRNVTLIENHADENGGGLISGERCTLGISNSTIISNTADDTGGGMFLSSSNSTHVRNSTIALNTARIFGGGIFAGGPLTLTNVTLMDNQVPRAGNGGGLLGAGVITVVNSIIAASRTGNNCAVANLTAFNSLSSDNTCPFPFLGLSNRNNTDPMLNPLGDHAGPTLTYLPKAGSPAIDGVIGTNAPMDDQRGFSRPVGAGYDIGAVERQPDDSARELNQRVRLPLVVR